MDDDIPDQLLALGFSGSSHWIWLGALILVGAYFAFCEAVLFSLSRTRLRELANGPKGWTHKIASELLHRPYPLFIAHISAETIALIWSAAILGTKLASLLNRFFDHLPAPLGEALPFLTAVGITGIALLFLLHVFPRGIASMVGEKAISVVAGPVLLTHYLFAPLRLVLIWITDFILSIFRADRMDQDPFSGDGKPREDLLISPSSDLMHSEERKMIEGILDFDETQVKEILVPRTDMHFVRSESKLRDALQVIQSSGHSRIPVVGVTVDTVLGVIHARDLLPHLLKGDMDQSVQTVLRPTIYVPDTKRIGELMREMQRARTQIAIAVDEYGGTAGLVTLEDIVEEIVGEIHDEYDVPHEEILPIGERTFLVDGGLDLDELNTETGIELPTEEHETLGGFILEIMGHIPKPQEQVTYDGVEFTITHVDENRIRKVKIEISPKTVREETRNGNGR